MEVIDNKRVKYTAASGFPNVSGTELRLNNIMAMDANVTLMVQVDRGEQVSFGFVQVLNLFVFRATYNLNNIPGADAVREIAPTRRYPIRDAMAGTKPPWYDGYARLVVGTGAQTSVNCVLDDNPSAPTLLLIDPTYGKLSSVIYRLSFTTWLAYFNHTIARIVALQEATTTMDFQWIVDSADFKIKVHTEGFKPPSTKIPLEVWLSEGANSLMIIKPWQRADGYDGALTGHASTSMLKTATLTAALAEDPAAKAERLRRLRDL